MTPTPSETPSETPTPTPSPTDVDCNALAIYPPPEGTDIPTSFILTHRALGVAGLETISGGSGPPITELPDGSYRVEGLWPYTVYMCYFVYRREWDPVTHETTERICWVFFKTGDGPIPTPYPTPSPVFSPTPTISPTPSPTPSPPPTSPPTPSFTPSPSASPTASPSPVQTPHSGKCQWIITKFSPPITENPQSKPLEIPR